ncbi:MBL fold metallo-hydrolase [Biformimicrobium ophioploci]|uniref:beta-lactamase n=1 Tax=Biformimicrobium ophioploci TaxID=3036711 RepID=A0ABQ6LYH7_9GAMM|nr:MBL fold metallo-hydrolase [Microbulbifer sp. NKW57]GMG87113.1 MBL fold metallo-hydrolase [Microbulbifer sp. NKW57]
MKRFLLPALALLAQPVLAQNDMSEVEITTEQVAENIHMLQGRGGNIGVSVGEDGVFMVDDQYAPLTGKILKAISELSDKPVRFVINTHWHGDHTGGNENLSGEGALIIAHENVRKRMSADQVMEVFKRTVPAAPEAALPVITFTDATTFYWNDEEIHVFHIDPAHTDGDSIVHFRKANVIHMGDTFFNGSYPFVDTSAGGDIDGVIANAERIMALSDEKTRIIPGHGPLTDKAGLTAYRDLLVELRDRIKALVDKGMSREAVIAAKPTAEYDEKFGQGFMKPDIWTGIVYDSLTGN